MLNIIRTTSDDQDFRILTKLLDKELNEIYGAAQAEYDPYNVIEFMKTVVIAYAGKNPVGCGCFKSYEKGTVEIKRMYVKPDSRGEGIAGMILDELEKMALEKKFQKCMLETGIRQPEAIAFYTKKGYAQIENYGPYKNRSVSVCFSKELNAEVGADVL